MIDRDKLLSLLGEEDMVDRMIDIFENDMPGYISDLQSAVASEDWDALSITAHTIKSQVAYLGLDQAESIAYEIEQKAENEEDTDQLADLVNDLDSELSQYL